MEVAAEVPKNKGTSASRRSDESNESIMVIGRYEQESGLSKIL